MVVVLSTSPYKLRSQTLRFNTGDPLRFGMGYNTLTGKYAGNCTVDVKDADVKPAGDGQALTAGQLTRWELSSEQDLSVLIDKMDFSASASASFVAASASISTQFMKSKVFNKYHEFLYVSASVANGTKIWTNPHLNTAGPTDYLYLRSINPIAFLKSCGDTFVKTITSGGELTAVLDVTTSAQEDISSLTVSMSGDYSGVQGRARLAQEIQQRLSNRNTQVKVIRDGGVGALPNYSADELIKASLDFPISVSANPSPLQAQLASYDTIAPPVDLTVQQEKFIKPLFRAYKATMQNLGNLSYIQSHTAEFRRIASSLSAQSLPQTDASAAHPSVEARLFEFIDKSQLVISSVFDFEDLDRSAIDNSINEQQSYADSLESLANDCLANPKTKCDGELPKRPHALDDLVRTFAVDKDWNTAAGPVDITLDPAYYCKVENISGNWKPGDGRTLGCDALPHNVTNGHIVTGQFDNPTQYGDNVGTCTYHFICTRR